VTTSRPGTAKRSDLAGALSGFIGARKDINQTIPGGQHLDPTQSLINAEATTCQEDFYHRFYCDYFSKSSKKFDLNLLGAGASRTKGNAARKQYLAACSSTCV
jgi:hypothetical protein